MAMESMMPPIVRTFLPLLALAGCATPIDHRGMETTHQPVVTGDAAHVPGCPDWSDAQYNAGDGLPANFGCATSTNLAAMIADPQDLLHGRAADGSDPYVAARAVKTWRELTPTGKGDLKAVSTGKASTQ